MRTTRKLSKQTKDKISRSMSGARNPNFGKPLKMEHRDKIREAMLKYWRGIPKS